MLYAALIYTPDLDFAEPETAQEWLPQYAAFRAEAGERVVGGKPLTPTATATTVRVLGARGGEVVLSDGPYAETKEALTGFFLLDCVDLDEAVTLAAKIPGAWHGAVEVRPVANFDGVRELLMPE
jgi:hypothetical protein